MVSTRFTDRNGGVSKSPYAGFNLALHVGDDPPAVYLNREILGEAIGPLVFMTQVHGDTVVVVDGVPSYEPVADALVTQEIGIALIVLVADCIPLLLWDEKAGCIGVAHVGRRGLVNGITGNVIEVMEEMGARDIQAHLGPSICGKCYEVGPDVYEEVGNLYPRAKSMTIAGTLALDLSGALLHFLQESGIRTTQSHLCTFEDPNLFSYRREGVTGRQAGAIWM